MTNKTNRVDYVSSNHANHIELDIISLDNLTIEYGENAFISASITAKHEYIVFKDTSSVFNIYQDIDERIIRGNEYRVSEFMLTLPQDFDGSITIKTANIQFSLQDEKGKRLNRIDIKCANAEGILKGISTHLHIAAANVNLQVLDGAGIVDINGANMDIVTSVAAGKNLMYNLKGAATSIYVENHKGKKYQVNLSGLSNELRADEYLQSKMGSLNYCNRSIDNTTIDIQAAGLSQTVQIND